MSRIGYLQASLSVELADGAFRKVFPIPSANRQTIGPERVRKATPLFAPTNVDAVFGSLAHEGEAKTIAEMDIAIAVEARRR